MLERAGPRGVDALLAGARSDGAAELVERAAALFAEAMSLHGG